MTSAAILSAEDATRPWRRAVVWLAGLAPFFYLTYGLANWAAGQRAEVGAIVFDWERDLPFLAWTIFPYWSINLFYGFSLLVCRTRGELDRHGRRLLTAQIVAVACFLAFPLRFTWPKPEVSGAAGFMFDALAGFDKPFNQAPSLHIALLVILWVLYERHAPRALRWPLHLWFALIGASVLTTYQHHFIDIPTGALLGFLCLWLWPDAGPNPLAAWQWAREPRQRRFAMFYGVGALAVTSLALMIGGIGLWLLWPAVSLLLVALAYAGLGSAVMQKGRNGQVSLAARMLLLPYRIGAWVNARVWTRAHPGDDLVVDGVSLGRFPTRDDVRRRGYATVVDLSAEFPVADEDVAWIALPVVDRVTPEPALLREAAQAIETGRRRGPVLVCCALGYARSAAAVATWLLASGRARDVDGALTMLARSRPRIVLEDVDRMAIVTAARMA